MWDRLFLSIFTSCVLGVFAADVVGQERARPDDPPPVAELRLMATDLSGEGLDENIQSRARLFLELTALRAWTYFDKGKTKTYRGEFLAEVVRNDKLSVKFRSGAFVPLELLSEEDQQAVAEIRSLQTQLLADYQTVQRQRLEAEARRIEAIEAARAGAVVPLIQVTGQTKAIATVDGRRRFVPVVEGERFALLGETDAYYQIEVLDGQPAWLDKRFAAVVRTVRRPVLPIDAPPPPEPVLPGELPPPAEEERVPPPDIDVRLDFFSDGAAVVTEVLRGGLAERDGTIGAGDLLILVNGREVHSMNDFRAAAWAEDGELKLTLVDGVTGRTKVAWFTSQPPSGLGLEASPDRFGEMVVTSVRQGGIADRLGLRRGDKLLEVNDLAIRDETDLAFAESAARGRYELLILRYGERVARLLRYP